MPALKAVLGGLVYQLAPTDVSILKKILENGKPIKAYGLEKMGVPHSTLFRRLPILLEQRNIEVAKNGGVFERTGMPSRLYDCSIQGFLLLAVAKPDYVLDKLGDFGDFFPRHRIPYDPDALKGMVKIWIHYVQRLPRIDGKIPYDPHPDDPHLELLSNINRGILSIALSRVNPQSGSGGPWLVPPTLVTPRSLRPAFMSVNLIQTEANAILKVMHKNKAHLKNTDMALYGEAEFEMEYGEEEPEEYRLRAYLPRKGRMFKVQVRLNPGALKDDLPDDHKWHPLKFNDIKEVKATRI